MVRTTDQKVPHYVVLTIPHFFIPKNSFFTIDLKEANKKIWVTMGVRGVTYIKDWFKPILPLFVT